MKVKKERKLEGSILREIDVVGIGNVERTVEKSRSSESNIRLG